MIIVSQRIAANPSICAPNCILIASPSFNTTAASASSDFRGVYGVTKEEGEIVVGEAVPNTECQPHDVKQGKQRTLRYLRNLLSSEHLSNLLFQQLVTFLADGNNLFSGNTQRSHSLEDLLRDDCSTFVLGEGVRVV